MRIGINLLYRVSTTYGGIETYAQRLINELVDLDTRNEYVIFVSDTAEIFTIPARDNVDVVRCKVDSKNRPIRYFWEQTVLPAEVITRKVQLLHSMNYVSPVLCPCKTIVTFTDVSFRDSNVDMPISRRLGLSLFATLSAKA